MGRDIEYRELELERSGDNVWQLVSDSRTQPELLGDRIVYLLSELMRDRTEFIGTPTELSEQIDPVDVERISPKKVSRQILQNLDALRKIGISAVVRRSNGRRLIELQRAESDDTQGVPAVDPVDPAIVKHSTGGAERAGDADSSLWEGQAEPSSDFVGLGPAGNRRIPGRSPDPLRRQ